MGIRAFLKQITPDEFEIFGSHPDAAYSMILGYDAASDDALACADKDPEHPSLRLEKSWDALHFLLNGETATRLPSKAKPPLSNAIFGGQPIPDDHDALDSPARRLSAMGVRDVSAALAQISVEDLLARYNAKEMTKKKIYGMTGDEKRDRDDLAYFFEQMKSYYAEAASKGNAMLLYTL